MKKSLILLLSLLLTSCVSYIGNNLTFDEMIDANTKTIKNANKQEVQQALIKVFKLARNDYFSNIAATEDNVYFKTQQNPYWILGFSRIITTLSFNLTEDKNNVKINIFNKTNTFVNILAFINEYQEDVINNPALNELIIKRTNYLLGKTNKWYTCKEYSTFIKANNIKGDIDALCWLSEDIHPSSREAKDIIN